MSEVACTKVCSGWRCKRVARDGVVYRCTTVLSETLGLTRSAVHQSLHRHGDADHCGIKKGKQIGTPSPNRKPVSVGVHQWPSISAMAVDLNVDRSLLRRMLTSDMEWVVAKVMAWDRTKEVQKS